MPDCNACKDKRQEVEPIPYIVHEAAMARNERQVKRMWIAIVVMAFLIFASNVGWLIYESLYDTITYSQDGAGLNNINTGTQGDVTTDVPKDEVQTETER